MKNVNNSYHTRSTKFKIKYKTDSKIIYLIKINYKNITNTTFTSHFPRFNIIFLNKLNENIVMFKKQGQTKLIILRINDRKKTI